MFNHFDTRQVQALVDHRREQVVIDTAQARQAIETSQVGGRGAGAIRTAIGIQLIRIGARVAGVYVKNGPQLSPGV